MTVDKSNEPSSPRSKSPAGGEDEFVRLHITPLDADLLKIVVPSAVLPTARNISFHTIETFPERKFGYVELPRMEADKLKKKLNGATLKGSKMRIEKARPEKKRHIPEEDETPKKKTKRSTEDDEDTRKNSRRGVIEGMVLHDRKVKRGWTEPLDFKKKTKKDKDAKKKEKDENRTQTRSKYTEKEECLLKTKLPPNVASTLPTKEEEDSTKKRKKKKNNREVTVHEFENTTKFPSFLRDSAPNTKGKASAEFVEGKGWVDEEGNVVEELKEKVKPKPTPKPKKAKIVEESSDDSTSSSGSSSESDISSDSSSDEESDDEIIEAPKATSPIETKTQATVKANTSKDDTPSSDSSPESSSDSSSDSSDSDSDADASTTPAKSLTINIPPPPATPSTKAVHPLEALYKPSAADDTSGSKSAAPSAQPFSFFGGEDDDIENDEEIHGRPDSIAMPMTPYTRQDFEWRNIRSAAPTPDTAHPPRIQPLWAGQDQDDEMEDEAMEEAYNGGVDTPGQGTSDFQKWFWENRGDLNRSWMTRRKTAAKEKRHRDNKTRASKAV